MTTFPHIFNATLVAESLSRFPTTKIQDFAQKFQLIGSLAASLQESHKQSLSHENFWHNFLGKILGYTEYSAENPWYYLEASLTKFHDKHISELSLGFFSKPLHKDLACVLMILSDPSINLDAKLEPNISLVEETFARAYASPKKYVWIIICNFLELRLYKATSPFEYELFDLQNMQDSREFTRLYFFLCRENLIAINQPSVIDELYLENQQFVNNLNYKFFNDYHIIRKNLFLNLKHSTRTSQLKSFTKLQKILNRFIFIAYCSDHNIIHENIYKELLHAANVSYALAENKLWDEFQGLCQAIYSGNEHHNIFKYNFNLFKEDKEIDALKLSDNVLESLFQLSSYNFNTEIDDTLLRYFFERYADDVQHINSSINITNYLIQPIKHHFLHTPHYVLQYIVKQTVGIYLTQAKQNIKQKLFASGAFCVSVCDPQTGQSLEHTFSSWHELEAPQKEPNTSVHSLLIQALHLQFWQDYYAFLQNVKICDPCCGSGVFLVNCLEYLHNEYLDVVNHITQLSNKLHITDAADHSKLLANLDASIVKNNLYGVDIHPECVEITKLFLSIQIINSNNALPSLDQNIKCGNALIHNKDVTANALNWSTAFQSIFAKGGFDIVLGHPPYNVESKPDEKIYYYNQYKTLEDSFDTYRIFFELGIDILKEDGYLGFITPDAYLTVPSGKKLHEFLFNNTFVELLELNNIFPNDDFKIIFSAYCKKEHTDDNINVTILNYQIDNNATFISDGIKLHKQYADFASNQDTVINYRYNHNLDELISEIQKNSEKLTTDYLLYVGARAYEVGKGDPPQTKEMVQQHVYTLREKQDDSCKPLIDANMLERFTTKWDGTYIKYGENLAQPRSATIYARTKILIKQTASSIIAQLDENNIANNSLFIVFAKDNTVDNKYLLGLLNSSFMNWFYQIAYTAKCQKFSADKRKTFLKDLPIKKGTQEQTNLIINYVTNLINLCQQKYREQQTFVKFIQTMFPDIKITKKFTNFEKFTINNICDEITKQKYDISQTQFTDLENIFKDQLRIIFNLSQSINENFLKLDDIVFAIYGIDQQSAQEMQHYVGIEL